MLDFGWFVFEWRQIGGWPFDFGVLFFDDAFDHLDCLPPNFIPISDVKPLKNAHELSVKFAKAEDFCFVFWSVFAVALYLKG